MYNYYAYLDTDSPNRIPFEKKVAVMEIMVIISFMLIDHYVCCIIVSKHDPGVNKSYTIGDSCIYSGPASVNSEYLLGGIIPARQH